MTEYFYRWNGHTWYLSDGSEDFHVGANGAAGPAGTPGLDSPSKAISYKHYLFQSNARYDVPFEFESFSSVGIVNVNINNEILNTNIPPGLTLQYLVEAYLIDSTLTVTDDNISPTTFATLTTISGNYEYQSSIFTLSPNYNQGLVINLDVATPEAFDGSAIGINLIAQWI